MVKQDENVTVYTSDVSGSPYKSFKAVGVAQTTPKRLLAILQDVESYSRWFAYTNKVRLLKREMGSVYIHMETDFPWPFRNQDMTYQLATIESDDGAVKLLLDGKPEYIPAIDGVHRMHKARGYISLQSIASQTTVTYVMHTELSGHIPPPLANRHIHQMPFQTISNLIDIADRQIRER